MTNYEKIKNMNKAELAQTDGYVVFTDKLLSIDGENINEKRD